MSAHSSENGDKAGMAKLAAQQSENPLPGGVTKKWRAGVLGATGLVGQRLVKLLADHPWFEQPRLPTFVTAGRMVTHKDQETMIRALAIHRRRFDSRLVILGTGPLDQQLRELVAQLGLEQAVDFAGFRSNVLPYIRQADAFLLSSRCEGFGNVIVEALGCGTPVIATRCEYGPAEILDEGRYGVLVETRNPAAMAGAMDQVATLRDRFPAAMLRQRAGEFSYAACASRYMALFKSLTPHRAWAT